LVKNYIKNKKDLERSFKKRGPGANLRKTHSNRKGQAPTEEGEVYLEIGESVNGKKRKEFWRDG